MHDGNPFHAMHVIPAGLIDKEAVIGGSHKSNSELS